MALRLDQLDGENGFRIKGVSELDYSGRSVAGAGDVNRDGVDDLIVGAYLADPEGRDAAGESYVVFGSSGGFDASLDLADLDGTDGFRLAGIDEGDFSGLSVAGAGDVNGDGVDDLIVGAPYADPAGESYVVFGTAAGFAANFRLADLDGTNGFRLGGIDASDSSGHSVAGVGDVNGDSVDDLIIGAFLADADGRSGAGESYVVFGSSAGFSVNLDLGQLDGVTGFRLDGIDADDRSGEAVAGAGDVNGDGIDDLIIGAPGAAGYTGASFVVFGSSGGFPASLDLGDLDGANGFRIDGIDEYDISGVSVAGAGDVNGDGVDDLIVGAFKADPDGRYDAGESYVVFGSSAGFAASLDLAALDGANGFRIVGIDELDNSGVSVAGAGDFNGDGFDDVIVGAQYAGYVGESYVVFGSASGFDASLDLADLNGANGISLTGFEDAGRSGLPVAGAGDVNGDGLDDVIIGGSEVGSEGRNNAGESYVVFGFRPPIRGGPGSDELVGTAFSDRMFGRSGDDVLDGGDGRDRLKGGRGDDRVDGGAGRDRIMGGRDDDRLTGGGGADVFVFKSPFGSDRVRDFDADPAGGQDRLDLRRLGITEAGFEDAVTIADLGEDAEVAVEGHGTILCRDVSGDALDASDFLLLA